MAAGLLPLLAFLFAPIACLRAQNEEDQDQQAKFTQLRDEKMALPVFQKVPLKNAWTFDYDVARKRAKEEGKVIFTYFTRSWRG